MLLKIFQKKYLIFLLEKKIIYYYKEYSKAEITFLSYFINQLAKMSNLVMKFQRKSLLLMEI